MADVTSSPGSAPLGSVLVARELPTSGGDTKFLSTYDAFEVLPPWLQERLRGMRDQGHQGAHLYLHRRLCGREPRRACGRGDREVEAHVGAAKPLVRARPLHRLDRKPHRLEVGLGGALGGERRRSARDRDAVVDQVAQVVDGEAVKKPARLAHGRGWGGPRHEGPTTAATARLDVACLAQDRKGLAQGHRGNAELPGEVGFRRQPLAHLKDSEPDRLAESEHGLLDEPRPRHWREDDRVAQPVGRRRRSDVRRGRHVGGEWMRQ